MARSLSNAKLFSAFVVDGVSKAISRRGYASVPQGVERVANVAGVKRAVEEKSSWVPDPVTGYYRPESVAGGKVVDVAELRALLLKNKTQN